MLYVLLSSLICLFFILLSCAFCKEKDHVKTLLFGLLSIYFAVITGAILLASLAEPYLDTAIIPSILRQLY